MNDPIIAQFAQACGACRPLDLRVDLVEGGRLAEGSVAMPLALIGRDDACDVTLTDAEVNPRHAWVQVVAGRAFAVDLGSRTGLGWPGGQTGSGWMDADTPVRVGPFQIRLRSAVSPRPAPFPAGYNPLQSDPTGPGSHPAVSLEFRNGRRARDRWTVNRLLTLVGRAPECKIHLTADDISGYHCGLVLTPDGLWVVDLSARGVVVNGERMRVAPLPHGAELWVGRFLIGVQYSAAGPAAKKPAAHPRPDDPLSAGRPPEDEVPLGLEGETDPHTGLPNSHIMADVFRMWTPEAGPGSHPIAVGNSGALSPTAPPVISTIPPPRSVTPPGLLDMLATPDAAPAPPLPPIPGDADEAAMLLRRLGEIHAQLFTQFQNSLVLMVRLFGCLKPEQHPAIQRELSRIQELNAELAQLQGEVARRAAEAAAPPPAPAPRPGTRVSTPTPLPDDLPPTDSTALHEWVIERINSLQRERQSRWQSLVGMFGGKAG